MPSTLEKLYGHVPVWAQNLGISLYGLMWFRERFGGDYARHVTEYWERDRWSKAQMDQFVQEQLRERLVRAFEHVPYYRERWRQAGFSAGDLKRLTVADLSRLPETPKEDLRRKPDAFVDGTFNPKQLRRHYSSGSTGTPITAICSADDYRRFVAAREVRSFGWAGTSVRSPRSMLGGRLVVRTAESRPPFYRYNFAEKQVYFSAYHISPRNAPSYVEGFNRYKPVVFTGYAQSHYLLGRILLEEGLSLDYQPEAIILSSEKVTREMRVTLAQAFGARAYEEYGAVENCVLATECDQGNLHVSPDFGLVEIVDDAGQPVGPGEVGRLLCTGFANTAQPLIRYDIGDLGVWSDEACACGRDHLPVIREIVGRLEDVIIGPDGRQMVRFHGLFINLPRVIEAQVIQERIDLLRVRVVVADDFSADDEEAIRRRVTEERLPGMNVLIERVPALERSERGKLRAVISKLTPEERQSARMALSR